MISVIMGVHRIDEYFDQALTSILEQSLSELELIVIANGIHANDIKKYIKNNYNDNRLIIITSQIGQLAHALNLGIDASKYEFIARMDSDDIAHPDRLKLQLEYLQKHNLDLVGTAVNLINEKGEAIGDRQLAKTKNINKYLPFKSTFVHPTVLFRKKTILKVRGYNAGFNSEDYDLWLRMKRKGSSWANMEEKLLSYRIHNDASQGRLLGYAECAGYSVREFLLHKNLKNFVAIFIQFAKALIKPDKSKKD